MNSGLTVEPKEEKGPAPLRVQGFKETKEQFPLSGDSATEAGIFDGNLTILIRLSRRKRV